MEVIKYSRKVSSLTGVYRIFNLINGKFYIGSASLKFSTRRTHHFRLLEKDMHFNIHLQNAVNKYRIENFLFEIIEICDSNQCEEREQFYIDTLKPEYNITLFVGKGRKGLPATQKMKDVASLTHKGKIVSDETRKKQSKVQKGLKRSQESIDKMIKSRLGKSINKGRVQTEEEKDKRSKSGKDYHKNNPKLSIEEMKELLLLRSQNKTLKFLMEKFKISGTLLENILYSKEYRIYRGIEDYYKETINYKQIRQNQYNTKKL